MTLISSKIYLCILSKNLLHIKYITHWHCISPCPSTHGVGIKDRMKAKIKCHLCGSFKPCLFIIFWILKEKYINKSPFQIRAWFHQLAERSPKNWKTACPLFFLRKKKITYKKKIKKKPRWIHTAIRFGFRFWIKIRLNGGRKWFMRTIFENDEIGSREHTIFRLVKRVRTSSFYKKFKDSRVTR